ncbi:MAG: aspartyl-phosphate phosphatase Spo0E family protein [Desulfitobacteriaceae bacterium]
MVKYSRQVENNFIWGCVNMSPAEILCLIENLRLQLINLVKSKPLSDPEVIKLSQLLDSYLNLYHNIILELLA